ncbi:FABP family protein [Corynebacterium breve]|uniref:Ferric nitrobindin-like protein n=1 Tax=Corynebacterium breve TaxID=3049799 RepID=A0ABY8VGA9_9CORY|nr:FABP family protein [Corynebacterium breve]WIM67308.1 FABP family protein [Corynebacterium breve]
MSDGTTSNTSDESQPLNGNDAVNLAAEQSQGTAHRNIPALGLDELPLHDDTANLRQGPSLHDGLLALLPLVGVWQGTGQGNEDGKDYSFGQQLVIAHDGENYLRFDSRIWRMDDNGASTGADQRETGFWRINLKDEIEVTLTNTRGLVEILYGEPMNERAWQLESASTIVTASGPEAHGPGKRLYGLMPDNSLGWVDERVVDGELTPYMSAQLKRIAG